MEEYGKALEFMLKAITIREKILPDNHPDLAASYNNVGNTYRILGDLKKALDFHLKAFEIWQNILPQNHPNIATSCSHIAFTLGKMSRFSEAMPYIQQAVTIAECSLPDGQPDLANYREVMDYLNFAYHFRKRASTSTTPSFDPSPNGAALPAAPFFHFLIHFYCKKFGDAL